MDLETKHQFIKDVIAECEKVLVENTGNRCAKYCKEYLASSDGKDLDSKGKMNNPVPPFFQVALNNGLTRMLLSNYRLDDFLQVHQNRP